ncbi:MAG: hypothetical protein R3202_01340 [Candidatus Competibacterales bacterium]|nr:hypothetical protein [Candidatus Competibacterales bacterium]
MSVVRRRLGNLVKLLALLALIVLGNLLSDWIAGQLDIGLRPSNEHIFHRILMVSVVAYTLLMAFPFVPGVEIGLGLIAMFGPPIVFLVYCCTVAALSLSFLVGRLIPEKVLVRLLGDLRLHRTSRLLAQLETLDTEQRLRLLLSRAPTRWVPGLIRWRYVAIALAFNLPGNVIIGGGGGIAMMAGMSRLFDPVKFLLTVLIAVSPVPLFVLLLGD